MLLAGPTSSTVGAASPHTGFGGLSPEVESLARRLAVGHAEVAVDREGVVESWTSPLLKEAVRRRGVVLVSYRDVAAGR